MGKHFRASLDVLEDTIREVRIVIIANDQKTGKTEFPVVIDPHYQDCLKFSGGRVEMGESLAAAAIREAEEETGVKLTESDLMDLSENDAPIYINDYPVKVYVAKISSEKLETEKKKFGDEGEIVHTVKAEQIKSDDDHGGDRLLIFRNHRPIVQILQWKEFI